MSDVLERIRRLIHKGARFTYENFSTKNERGYPEVENPDWLVWRQHVAEVAILVGKGTTAASSIRQGLTIPLMRNGGKTFEKAKTLLMNGLRAALVLAKDKPTVASTRDSTPTTPIEKGFAFIAMPMDPDDHSLADVHDAIKDAAKECQIRAARVDDEERNERITDRILAAIDKAEFVIVDLVNDGKVLVEYRKNHAYYSIAEAARRKRQLVEHLPDGSVRVSYA